MVLVVVVADVTLAGVVHNGGAAPAGVDVVVPGPVEVDVVGVPLGGPPCPTEFMATLTAFGSVGAIGWSVIFR